MRISDRIRGLFNRRNSRDNDGEQGHGKERINIEINEGNGYYEKAVNRLRSVCILLILVLVIFVVGAFSFRSDVITYKNFYYLMRDFNMSVVEADISGGTISYADDDYRNFAFYRKGLAVVGKSGLSMYSSTGRKTLLSDSFSYAHPQIVPSDRYMMVYSLGGKEFSIYNSFFKIYSEALDYPIKTADISSSGTFAVATRSDTYNSVVRFYNSNFECVWGLNKSAYVTHVLLTEDGSRMAVVSITNSNDAVYLTDVQMYRTNDAQLIYQKSYEGLFPVSVEYAGGNLAVIFDNALVYLDGNGNEKAYYSLDDLSVSACSATEYGCVIAFSDKKILSENSLIVFDKDGNLSYNGKVSGNVNYVTLYEDRIFASNAYGITMIKTSDGSQSQHSCSCLNSKILVYDKNTVVLCTDTKSTYIIFEK